MKSPASLARKLADRVKAAPFAEPERIVEKITDVVRYTAISPPEHMVATARAMAAGLSHRGWMVIEAEQSYLDGNQYKGLHMLARHPDGWSPSSSSTPTPRSRSRTTLTSTMSAPATPAFSPPSGPR
ncbi:hypothetical protein NJ76_23330 [Rhodococcus sp. IITR03]|nr:hypothetical protein NJ76_23330 [Rhodococcus sp. IITR03]